MSLATGKPLKMALKWASASDEPDERGTLKACQPMIVA